MDMEIALQVLMESGIEPEETFCFFDTIFDLN